MRKKMMFALPLRFLAFGLLVNARSSESNALPSELDRIVNGNEVKPRSWPWQVSIKYRGNNWHHLCGGSVIHPRWVITAAHCVYRKGSIVNFQVVLGEHNLYLTEGIEEESGVQQIIIHEKYNDDTLNNDIALLHLPKYVHFNDYVKPICLPEEDVEDGILCTATGWGETKSTGFENVLNEVDVPIISRTRCNQSEWYNGTVTDNMICAGYPEGGKDSCQGDSGGPLVCKSEGRWKLYGLTSWGKGCAKPHRPGVYTRVTKYLEWIQSNTNMNILPSYTEAAAIPDEHCNGVCKATRIEAKLLTILKIG